MEGIRDNSSSERASGDTSNAESTKQDSKKKSSIRVPLGAVSGAERPESKPETEKPSRFSEALAELSLKSREAAESKAEKRKEDELEVSPKSGKPAEPETLPAVAASEQPLEKAVEAAAEKKDDDDDETDKTDAKSHKKSEPVTKSEKQSEKSEFATDQKNLTEQFLDETKEKSEQSETANVEPESAAEGQYEPLPEYEPKPNELNTGEVIIPLDGDRTIEERVVLLRGSELAAAEELPHAEEPAETPPPFWNFQPEQQHQARFETPESEQTPQLANSAFEDGSSTSGPETASENRDSTTPEAGRMPFPDTSESPDVIMPYPVTNAAYYEQVPPAVGGATPVQGPEKVATQQDVEDAIYYATKSGQRRGLITGLFVGGLYEHFKHRRREKKAEKRFKQQGKQLEQTRQNLKFNQQEQERQNAEARSQLVAAERKLNVPQPSQETRTATVLTNETLGNAAHATEQARVEKQSEKLIIRTPEQIAAESLEQLSVAEGHRLETSVWHAIEVDAKTGKAVEDPTFQYGQEFHRERAKESMPAEPAATASGQASGPLDDMAAAAKIPSASTDGGIAPPANLPNATVQGEPSSPKDKAKAALLSLTKPKQGGEPPSQAGPIWMWLLALGVVVILLIVML